MPLSKDLAAKFGIPERHRRTHNKQFAAAPEAPGEIPQNPVEIVAQRLTGELGALDCNDYIKSLAAMAGATTAIESMLVHMMQSKHTEERRQAHLQKILRALHRLQNKISEPS